MKTCGICKISKDSTHFHKCLGNLDGLQHRCKTCKKKYCRIYYQRDLENSQRKAREAYQRRFLKNPDKVRADTKRWRENNPGHHIKFTYGLSIEQWDEMMLNQGGMCAICGCEDKLCVDHDHISDKIRGLLCRMCNIGVGNFSDSVTTVRAAADYLEKHS